MEEEDHFTLLYSTPSSHTLLHMAAAPLSLLFSLHILTTLSPLYCTHNLSYFALFLGALL
jgi:hypothetical protein